VWIERIVTETDGETKLLELHPRLTVIASPDDTLRRAAYERVYQGLKGIRGSHLEVVTENRDHLIALRPADGDPSLIDSRHETEILPENMKGIGIVGQLNDAEAMTSHLRLLHVTHDSLLRRATSDADMIRLAQTPLDQLWTLANSIQSDQEVLQHTETQGENLSAAAAERDATEMEISGILDRKADNDKRNQQFYMAAGVALGLAALAAVVVTPLAAAPFILIAIGLGAAGATAARNEDLLAEHQHVTDNYGSELGLALERVDQLFDNHSISRNQREARKNLDRSVSQWRDLAGGASPEILIRERPRLEELAGHLRVVNNESVADIDEMEKLALVGFASLLAELSRRFPSERVPLLIDDLFPSIHQTYHSVLRELIERASHRRQVVLETGDRSAIQWAAAEVVSGNALLITDQEIDFPELSSGADDPQQQAV
jgi:hypothetical protein